MHEIQAASVAHAATAAAIHAACFAPADRWDSQAMSVLLGMPGVFGFIHPLGGLVLARVAADECELLTLAVAPDTRRSGVARALLGLAEADAAARCAVAMFLEVAEDNTAARLLYGSCGYVLAGRRRRYYRSGADALLLRAPLIRA